MILAGRVAWFDIKKQFGFVKVEGRRDTFLHRSVLKPAGYVFLPVGTTLRFTTEVVKGKPRVAEIHAVDTSTAARRTSAGTQQTRKRVRNPGGPVRLRHEIRNFHPDWRLPEPVVHSAPQGRHLEPLREGRFFFGLPI
jgi:cold shock CspA family protein